MLGVLGEYGREHATNGQDDADGKEHSVCNRTLSRFSAESQFRSSLRLEGTLTHKRARPRLKTPRNYHKIGRFPGSSTVEHSAVNKPQNR